MDLSYPDCGEQIINQIDKAAPPVELLINNAANSNTIIYRILIVYRWINTFLPMFEAQYFLASFL